MCLYRYVDTYERVGFYGDNRAGALGRGGFLPVGLLLGFTAPAPRQQRRRTGSLRAGPRVLILSQRHLRTSRIYW